MTSARAVAAAGRRLLRMLRREGLAGVLARLRDPRQDRRAAPLARLALPVRVEGPDAGALRAALAAAGVACGDNAAAVLCRVTAATDLPRAGAGTPFLAAPPATDLARAVADWTTHSPGLAVLVPDGEWFGALTAAGVAPARLFILPPEGAPPQQLAAGLLRWLAATGAMAPGLLRPALFPSLQGLRPWDSLCLSLPETPARRAAFRQARGARSRIFDGLRLVPGWQGAAHGYRLMARAALDQGAVPLILCEDDVLLPDDYDDRLTRVRAYLSGVEWDVFSGLVTNLADSETAPVAQHHDGLTFVHLGQTIGMVYNILNRRALERLAEWSPDAGGLAENSIDLWLGTMPGLKVVTTLPFLAGHRHDLESTIFGFRNRRYASMIRASERLLARRAGVRLDDTGNGPFPPTSL